MNNKYLTLAALTLATSACVSPMFKKFVSGVDTVTEEAGSQIAQTGKVMSRISAQAACKECGKKPEERNPLITEEICKNWTKEECEARGFTFGE